jgi:hypothetical protein
LKFYLIFLWAGGVAWTAKHLLHKHKVLSSNPVLPKKIAHEWYHFVFIICTSLSTNGVGSVFLTLYASPPSSVSFPSLWQNAWENQLKESFILAPSFRGFSLLLAGSIGFRAVVKQKYHGREHMVEQSCSPYGSWEAQRRGMGPGGKMHPSKT